MAGTAYRLSEVPFMRVEEFDELGEIGERPCQPVDLVDDDDIDFAGPDSVQKDLQGSEPVCGANSRPARMDRCRL
jgi:hypothetical protein